MKLLVCLLLVGRDLLAVNAANLLQKTQRSDTYGRSFKEKCTHEDKVGLCFPKFICTTSLGGESVGDTCGLGKCCIITAKTCFSTLTKDIGYIVNPNYDDGYSEPGRCKYTVAVDDDTSQIRLDFIEFELEPTNDKGVCMTDRLVISEDEGGNTIDVCGSHMAGQHMYFAAQDDADLTLNFVLGDTDLSRKWKLLVTKIASGSADKAPDGCLQYYTDTTGTIYSMNFDTVTPEDSFLFANLNYKMCVKAEEGYDKIKWEVCDSPHDLFRIDEEDGEADHDCDEDNTNEYLLIPDGMDADGNVATYQCGDRLGGEDEDTANEAIYSTTMPFSITLFTDGKGDETEAGFCLKYTLETTK